MKKQQRAFPRLHIFLGAGGVGKTTLSAGFALALAESGKRVGLLSVDPAKRLQTALGLESLPELGHDIPLKSKTGHLRAALMHPGDSLRRWVIEETRDKNERERLLHNPFFLALADKLATATDTIAAIRMAEWAEQDLELEDLVIDTAPGIHAIDFLGKPERLMAFFDSKLIDWLKWFVADEQSKAGIFQKVMKTGARRILDGLAQIGGKNMLLSFAEFIVLLDQVILRMVRRLEYAKVWLRESTTDLVLVSAVRNDAASVSRHIGFALKELGLTPRAAVVNRAFPAHLTHEEEFMAALAKMEKSNTEAEAFVRYLRGFVQIQERAKNELAEFSKTVLEIPLAAKLDGRDELRLGDLTSLGENLRLQLRD